MADASEIECENVKVVIRVRPPIRTDASAEHRSPVQIDPDKKVITLTRPPPDNAPRDVSVSKSFQFDRVFDVHATQVELYKFVAFRTVDKVLQGYNGTVFAYGQTGTGKTYTMMGKENDPERRGIVPNAFGHIFGQISRYGQEKFFAVTATYLEIYNEDVRDLLSKNQDVKLEVRERSDLGVYVKGLMGFTIDSVESLHELMRLGNRNRTTRSTLMNRESSRSHAIFTITVESRDRAENNRTTVGKLNLVDLAGSERLHKTQASGDRLREATNINQSLSVLGSVISALVDGKSTHVPYRNSKLTRLLQDSLGGNSKTAMIATISPSESDFDESICTLRYAARVRHVKNRTKVNVETKRGLIESFEEEIAKLKHRIAIITLREERAASKLGQRKSKSSLEDSEDAYEEDLKKAEEEKSELNQKIASIQKKILIGGESLLKKAQMQISLLEMSDAELEILDKSYQELEEQIQLREFEKIDFAERYSDLQEENRHLTENIRTVQNFLQRSRREYAEKNYEYQNETAILNETSGALSKELQLADFIVGHYVPETLRRKVEANVVWNAEVDDFQVRGLQHAGNNIRETRESSSERMKSVNRDIKGVYRTYSKRKTSQ